MTGYSKIVSNLSRPMCSKITRYNKNPKPLSNKQKQKRQTNHSKKKRDKSMIFSTLKAYRAHHELATNSKLVFLCVNLVLDRQQSVKHI